MQTAAPEVVPATAGPDSGAGGPASRHPERILSFWAASVKVSVSWTSSRRLGGLGHVSSREASSLSVDGPDVGQLLPGRHADGNGLYLLVDPNGARRWIQRLVIGGRRRDLGLGGYSLVTLVDARSKALENRQVARSGGDPTQVAAQQIVPTLRSVVDDVIAARRAAWRGLEAGWVRRGRRMATPDAD